MNVEITPQQMYELLLKVDRTVTAMASAQDAQGRQLSDHEDRLRVIEAEEDLSRRIADLEGDIKTMSQQMEDMKKRLWAIPGASAVIAAAAVVLTLVRTY
jgi:TPP-dependent indolepyruvate ferredoxin oxidoreductase alpha subunit